MNQIIVMKIKITKKVSFKNPVLIEGLPGVGNVGRVVAGYMISQLKMKKFAEFWSPHFLPVVLLEADSTVRMLKNEFYYYKRKEGDIIILTGDAQSITSDGHYQLSEGVVKFAKSIGVKEIITVGGFSDNTITTTPRIIGAVNDKKLVKKYGQYIDFGQKHIVGTIAGASGLMLSFAKLYKIDALCILGETFGLPILTDPVSADKVLQTIKKILKLNIDLSKLEKTVNELEERIKKTESLHKKAITGVKDEQMKYIG